MKKFKLFKALMLMVSIMLISPQVWGADFNVDIDQIRVLPTRSAFVQISAGSNATASSGKLSIANSKTGTFIIASTIPATYKIKSIAITVSRNVTGFTCTDGGTLSGSNASWTFTPTGETPVGSASFSLNNTSGGAANMTFVVTMTTAETITVEELKTFSFSDPNFSFKSSAATSQVTIKNKANATASSNYISLSKSSSERSITIAAKTGYNLKFISFYYYESSSDPKVTPSVTAYTKASYTWIPSSTTTSVDFSFDASSAAIKIWKIYVGYEAAAACDAAPADPTGLAVGSITAGGATFTITDGANTNNYEIVCKTTSGLPAADATPTETGTSKTIAVTGLSDGTTYYAFVRSVCDASHKSSWVALGSSTFTTKSCSISSCGNATLTYVINVGSSGSHAEGGTDLISSATASNTTALGISTTPTYQTITMSDLTKKAAAAVSTCYSTKPNMTGKIGCYNGTSYSSTNYLQFSFTVNSGYTFTPCDIRLVVQPVDQATSFRWEVTDGTNSYGYGTATDVPKGSDGGASVLTGLSSTAEMAAGTYYIRLYPYTNAASKTFRLGTDVVLKGTTAAAAAPSCTDPDHVGISGSWRYFPGQTISLTATGYDDSDEEVVATGYQWQKEVSADNWSNLSNGTEAGVTISGATTNNLQITPCGTGNTGKYRCIVSTGATCSTNSDPFSVKIFTLNGAYDDGEFSSNNITFTSGTTGTATVHLAAGRVYKFKVTDNFGMWFGNSGRILEPASSWTFPSNNGDNCILFTGPEGDYTFTVDIDHVTYGTPEVVVSVAYPSVTHPAAGYAYFKNVDNWTNVGLYMWYEGGGSYTDWGSEPWVTKTTTICGDTYYYTPLIPSWYNRVIFREVGGSGQTTDITVANLAAYSGKYNDKSDANWHDFATYTISFNAGGGEGTMSSITGICPDADQLLPANTFEKTGYTFAGWEDASGNEYDDEATIEDISDDITLTAQWSPVHYDVSTSLTNVSVKSGTTGTGAATHGTAYTVTLQGATGYNLPATVTVMRGSTNITANCTWTQGTGVLTIPAAQVTGNISISATGVAKTTTLTFDANTTYHGTTGDGGATATYDATALASVTHTTPAAGYQLDGYYTTATGEGTKIVTASGTLVASTSYTTAGGAWHSELANLTLYARYTDKSYSVTHTFTNASRSSGGTTGTSAATHGTDYSVVVAATSGYVLPSTITVTIGGSTKTAGTEYTWNQGTGTVTIGGSHITGDIVITVSGTADCPSSGSGRTVYKWEVKSNVTDGNICSTQNVAVSLNTTTHLTTLTGGTLEGLVTSSSMNNLAFSSGRIQYANGTAGVLILTLNCAIKTGDIIRFVNYSSSNSKYNYLRHTSSSTTTNQITLNASTTAGTVQEIVVPSAFNNKEELYIVAGLNTTGISYFEIIRPYVVTLDANTNGGKVGGENTATMYFGQSDPQVLPHATKSDYLFKGWFNASSGGDAVANPYTATTSPKTLYAQFDDCSSTSGTVYKFQLKTGLTNGSLPAGVSGEANIEANVGNYLSSLAGGTMTIHNKNNHIQISDNSNLIIDDNGPYLIVNLDCALAAGDIFKSTTSTRGICVTKTATRNDAYTIPVGTEKELRVPAEFVGEKTLYLWRGSGSGNTKISYFEVYCPEGFAVTYHKNDGSAATQVNTVSTVEDNMFTRNGYTFVKWHTEADGTSGVDKAVGAAVTAAIDLYAIWECTTPTFGTDLSTTPHVVREGDDAVTLTVAASANSGTVTYQWYSNTSKSTAGATTLTTGATYNAPTSSLGTLYYYCVATNTTGGGCTAQSAYATVTVNEAPCFEITDAGKNGSSWPKSNGNTIANSDIDGTITDGTVTYTGSGSLTGNDTHGIIFDNDNDELTISLSGSHALVAGSVITIVQHGNSSTSKETGFKVSGNSMSPATCNNGSTDYKEMTQTYTVAAADGIAGTSGFTIKWTGTNQVYLKSITVTGCVECTPITPTLNYSKTTFWMDDATLTASPTLTGYYGSPTISYASSDPTVVRVDNSRTGAILALKRGTATITATIGATTVSTTDYCGNTATCVITVKDMECGNTTIAKATRSGTSASYSGVEGGSALVNNLDGSNYKLKSGGYVGVQLPSTLSFEAGDIVRIDLTIGDWWNGASADELPVVVYADNTGTNEIYRTDNYTKLTAQVVEFEVTSSMLTALATKQVTVYRQSSTETQNHVVNSVEIKRYACPDVYVFDAADNGLWSDEDNWIGATGRGSGIPTIEDRAIITKPITVDIAHATAAAVILDQSSTNTGKLTIEANKGLEVAGTVTRTTTGSNSLATREEDLVLESSSAGNASLIFNNSNGDAATVQMYSKASINRGTNTWNWQYVGTPFTGSIPLYNYYGSWMYKWNNGWDPVTGGEILNPFVGYCLTQESATTHVMGGTLVPTTSKSVTMAASTDMVLANSWTAPIWIGGFTEETFTSEPATIYLFNTGMGENDGNGNYKATGEGTEAGTYVTVPVNSAPYTGSELIAPMQGFFVTTYTGAAGTITMNYNDLVRPSGVHTGIVAGPMKAPRRAKVADAKPDVMKIWANGSEYNDRVVILAREDFSEGFDNGWDGEKLSFGNASPSVYVINEEGGYDAVSAIPEYEGTLVGFRAGSEDNVYTMTFEYNGDEVLYLNDLKAQMSAEIANGQTYMFTTEEGDSEVRFIISHNPIRRITTGVDEVVSGTKVRKIIINDKVYIIRKGRVYSVDGQIVK